MGRLVSLYKRSSYSFALTLLTLARVLYGLTVVMPKFGSEPRFEPEPNLGLKLAGNPLIFPEFWAQNCARYDI